MKAKLAAFFAALLGLAAIVFSFLKRKELEQKVENAEYEKTDAVLEEKQHAVERNIQDEIKRAQELKGASFTREEMEEFLKKM